MLVKLKKPLPPKVALNTWRVLVESAQAFQQLAPWTWMDSLDILGLQDAPDGDVRLASVLGLKINLFALVVYRGPEGLRFVLDSKSGKLDPTDLNIPRNMNASKMEFVSKNELAKEDWLVLQQLGFKPSAQFPALWPCFRSFIPGHLPWFIDQTEAEILLEDMRKFFQFALLARDHPDLYNQRKASELCFYPIRPGFHGPLALSDLEWRKLKRLPDPPPKPVQADKKIIHLLQSRPRQPRFSCELDSFYLNTSVSEPPRPYYTKMALLVDAGSGYVYGFQLGRGVNTHEEIAAQCLLELLPQFTSLPLRIVVSNQRLHKALQPLIDSLGLELRHQSELPGIEEARTSLEQYQLSQN